MEYYFEKAVNMKLILCIFEQLFGLILFLTKLRYSILERLKKIKDAYRHIFGCEIGSSPFKYCGIPIHIENC
jgi:hypothetical protein